MITGEYILDVVIFDKDAKEEIGKGNIVLNGVSIETSFEFYNLVKNKIKKDYGDSAVARIVGVFKL